MMHPWGLSKGEVRAIAALIEHQTFAHASEKLGMNQNAYKAAVQRARKKMGVESTLLAVVKFDRWAREKRPSQ